jgi:CRISPR type III-A-associated RAMP protein Csm4
MMSRLGCLEEWLAETTAGPAVRFSSLFPYHGETLYVTPPRSLWPPATSTRVRWASASFVPMSVVESLLAGKTPDEDNWVVDGASGCLVQAGGRLRGAGPFRVELRPAAAVDRLHAGVISHETACLEFADDAGMWGLVEFDGEEVRERWGHKVRSALRLLADSGIGGERSRGWGRSAMPSIRDGKVADLIFRNRGGKNNGQTEIAPESENAHWLLSLFSPAPDGPVDWRSGNYCMVSRSGRIESPVSSGDLKKELRMVAEGSILVSAAPPKGILRDVAPDGFPHPVYRCGYALAVPIRWGKAVPPPPPPPPPPAPIEEVVPEELPPVSEPPEPEIPVEEPPEPGPAPAPEGPNEPNIEEPESSGSAPEREVAP